MSSAVKKASFEACTHKFPIGLRRFAPAEVAKRPCGIPEHAEFVLLAEQSQQGPEGALLQDVISALRAITCDVTQSPNRLLADVGDRR